MSIISTTHLNQFPALYNHTSTIARNIKTVTMPSVRYYNQTAPFWDFIANLESQAGDHPFFSAYAPQAREDQPTSPSGDTAHHEGPPPPPEPHNFGGPPPPRMSEGHPHDHSAGETHQHGVHNGRHEGPGCGPGWGRRQHGWGPRRGGFGGPNHRGRGGFPFGGPGAFDINSIGQWFTEQLGFDPVAATNAATETTKSANTGGAKDFAPPCDVFDTEDAYVVHLSLPGAKKEDVGVNWDADKSELGVAGVIYRPGDENFLKTLAMDERQVGVFEKKIRLGSRASPANVEVDSIAAKMEDGILIVTVPKSDREYVEIRKVDIE